MDQNIKNLMFDRTHKVEIFDTENNRKVSDREADDVIREYLFSELSLNEKSSDKEIRRALSSETGRQFFAIIEEIIDEIIITGWKDNEFFNDFVEVRNMSDGDANEFWTDKDIILNVAKVAGDHHDLLMQKLASGSTFSVPTSVYGIKVGSDIRMFLTGRFNWNEFTQAVARAYVNAIQEELYAEFMDASNKLPVPAPFTGNGTLNTTSKDAFDEIISNVETVNGTKAVILGTKTALKKLNALTKVEWIADSQKESVARTGILGDYEGTTLIEIPQRFAFNKVGEKLVDDKKLLIFPVVDYKPIKMVDYGLKEFEITQVGEYQNDLQSFEAQRKMGVSTIITRYFGVWNL